MHTLKIDEGVFANISQGKNGKELVRILPNFRYIINDLQNFADFYKKWKQNGNTLNKKNLSAPPPWIEHGFGV